MINIDTRLLPKVNENEMWLLLHLTKRINTREKICWPSNATLCNDTGWNIEKLQKVKKSLLCKGIITAQVRPDKTNIYKLCTSMLSIFINLENVEFEETEPTGNSDRGGTGFSDRRYTGNSDKEVLTNEVLANEHLSSNDDLFSNTGINSEIKESKYEPSNKAKKTNTRRAAKPKVEKPKDNVYAQCVDYWLKNFHPGWTFGAVQGKALKSLINKIRTSSANANDATIVATFQKLCQSLPEWYKNQDLPVLDSKFNTLVTEIQRGPAKTWHQMNSAERFFSDYR